MGGWGHMSLSNKLSYYDYRFCVFVCEVEFLKEIQMMGIVLEGMIKRFLIKREHTSFLLVN